MPTGSETRSGATFVDDASVGTVAWNNPANAGASDNSYADIGFGSGPRDSHYLKATNFGFTEVKGTILGVVMEFERKHKATGPGAHDGSIKLVKGGTIQGNDKAIAYPDFDGAWPSSDTYKSYGSSSDLWGLALTRDDIMASNFGVAIAAHLHDVHGGDIDHIRLTVHYSFRRRLAIV